MNLIKPERKLILPSRRTFLKACGVGVIGAPAIVRAQVGQIATVPNKQALVASIPIALDTGTVTNDNSAISPLTTAIFTAVAPNCFICCLLLSNAFPPPAISSVTANGGASVFARMPGLTPPQAANTADVWGFQASGAFSSTITVTMANNSFTTAVVFGVVGAKVSAPYDANINTDNTGTACTITTTAANAMMVGMGVNAGVTPTNGFAVISALTAGTNFMAAAFKYTLGTPQSSPISWTSDPMGESIGFAFQQGP